MTTILTRHEAATSLALAQSGFRDAVLMLFDALDAVTAERDDCITLNGQQAAQLVALTAALAEATRNLETMAEQLQSVTKGRDAAYAERDELRDLLRTAVNDRDRLASERDAETERADGLAAEVERLAEARREQAETDWAGAVAWLNDASEFDPPEPMRKAIAKRDARVAAEARAAALEEAIEPGEPPACVRCGRRRPVWVVKDEGAVCRECAKVDWRQPVESTPEPGEACRTCGLSRLGGNPDCANCGKEAT